MRAVFYERKVYYMKFGYFDDANREYVITTPRTPYPWINYLGTQGFFSLISNTAGGYSFYKDNERWRAHVSEEKFSSLKSKVRILNKRSDPATTQEICKRITRLFRGWINYFQLADMKGYMEKRDGVLP